MQFVLSNSEKILEVNSPLFAPLEIDETLFFCSFNGEILRFSEGQLKLFTKLNGHIRGLAFDPFKSSFYAADLQKQAIVAVNSNDGAKSELVAEFEGVPFQGPHSLLVSNRTGNVFFTDCGPFGEGATSDSLGSVFVIDMQQQSIRVLAHRCLCAPTGLAFARNERLLIVSETGRNRLLRFYESEDGIYYSRSSPPHSVFHQFGGRFGPTALMVTAHDMLVAALFEFKNLSADGCLAFLSLEGEFLQKFRLVQCGPEISGLFLSRETEEDLTFLLTENSGRPSCHKLTVKCDPNTN